MKSKEALEEFYYCDTDNVVEKSKILYELLEKDLNRLEKLEKVIEIIRDNNVNIVYIKIFKDFEKYSEYYMGYSSKDKLTKEEFDLLKEVLENGL